MLGWQATAVLSEQDSSPHQTVPQMPSRFPMNFLLHKSVRLWLVRRLTPSPKLPFLAFLRRLCAWKSKRAGADRALPFPHWAEPHLSKQTKRAMRLRIGQILLLGKLYQSATSISRPFLYVMFDFISAVQGSS